jgi:hypothetical protein
MHSWQTPTACVNKLYGVPTAAALQQPQSQSAAWQCTPSLPTPEVYVTYPKSTEPTAGYGSQWPSPLCVHDPGAGVEATACPQPGACSWSAPPGKTANSWQPMHARSRACSAAKHRPCAAPLHATYILPAWIQLQGAGCIARLKQR